MEPIISPWIVYIVHMLSTISTIATVFFVLSIIGAILSGLFLVMIDDYEMPKHMHIIFKSCVIILIASSIAVIIIPDKQTMLAMLTLSFITPDNIEFVQDNIVDFVKKIFNVCKEVK